MEHNGASFQYGITDLASSPASSIDAHSQDRRNTAKSQSTKAKAPVDPSHKSIPLLSVYPSPNGGKSIPQDTTDDTTRSSQIAGYAKSSSKSSENASQRWRFGRVVT